MSDARLRDLMFLLSASFCAYGCPGEDDPAGEEGNGEGTTEGAATTGDATSGPSSMSGATSATSMTSATSATSTSMTSSDDTTASSTATTTDATDDASATDPSSGDASSSTTAGLGLCEEFGMHAEKCGVGTAADLEMYCDFTLNDAMVQGMDCYDASVDVFACALEVDCRALMGGPAGSCPEEYETAQTVCMG